MSKKSKEDRTTNVMWVITHKHDSWLTLEVNQTKNAYLLILGPFYNPKVKTKIQVKRNKKEKSY